MNTLAREHRIGAPRGTFAGEVGGAAGGAPEGSGQGGGSGQRAPPRAVGGGRGGRARCQACILRAGPPRPAPPGSLPHPTPSPAGSAKLSRASGAVPSESPPPGPSVPAALGAGVCPQPPPRRRGGSAESAVLPQHPRGFLLQVSPGGGITGRLLPGSACPLTAPGPRPSRPDCQGPGWGSRLASVRGFRAPGRRPRVPL